MDILLKCGQKWTCWEWQSWKVMEKPRSMMALLSSWNKPVIMFPPNFLFCEVMCPYCLCNWNWIFCYLGQKHPNWLWQTIKTAIVLHHLLYLWPVQNATLLLLLEGDNFSTSWIWAWDLLWTMLKSSEPDPEEALHSWFLTYGILLPPYKEAQASLCRRRKTVESNSVFPAHLYWAIKPSRPDQPMSWSQIHSGLSQASPDQTFGYPSPNCTLQN